MLFSRLSLQASILSKLRCHYCLPLFSSRSILVGLNLTQTYPLVATTSWLRAQPPSPIRHTYLYILRFHPVILVLLYRRATVKGLFSSLNRKYLMKRAPKCSSLWIKTSKNTCSRSFRSLTTSPFSLTMSSICGWLK